MKAEQLTDVQYHKLQDAKAIANSLTDDQRVCPHAYGALMALDRLLDACDKYAKREEVAPPF